MNQLDVPAPAPPLTAFAAAQRQRAVPGTWLAAGAGFAAAIIGGAWFVAQRLNIAQPDSLAHLLIARRIWDSPDPGLTQLGTTWLPAPHVLLAPFTVVLAAWANGWSGWALGAVCLAFTAAAIWRTAHWLDFGPAARIAAVGVILINPSIAYLHTTSLTEPVLIAAVSGTLAGLAHWTTRTVSPGELALFAGVPGTVAVLSRYEGWAVVAAGTVAVGLIRARSRAPRRRIVRDVAAFSGLPAVGALWWLAANYVVYQDPLAFMTGEYSAAALQEPLRLAGLMPTAGSLGLSLATFSWSVNAVTGPVLIAAALLGVGAVAAREPLSPRSIVLATATATYWFMLLSLFTGQASITNAHSLPSTTWNNRYAASVIIAIALYVASLIDVVSGSERLPARWRDWRGLSAVVLAVVAAQCLWFCADLPGRSDIIAEAYDQRAKAATAQEAARWLGSHYDGGRALLDENATANAVVPLIGLPLTDLILRSSSDYSAAVAHPAAHARWLFFSITDTDVYSPVADQVGTALNQPGVSARYRMVFANATHQIWKRVSP